jgi:hypothetical protein
MKNKKYHTVGTIPKSHWYLTITLTVTSGVQHDETQNQTVQQKL